MKSLRLAGLAATLLLCASAATGAALPGIRGDDDRVLVDSIAPPWNAIGRLNRQGGGFCTGFAIGRRTVMTAAHCLWNGRTLRWGGAQTIHFLAGYRRGEYLQHARVASYEIGAPSRRPSGHPAEDWAILTLSADLDERVMPLEVKPLDPGAARYLQAGYSQDKPHMLTVDRDCGLSTAAEGLLMHDCDATHGSSGAPLLTRNGDGTYAVVGLHIGHRRDGTRGIGISASDIISRKTGEKTR